MCGWEAFVDFVPSRGAKHRKGDTWIPLDAAFKQYNCTQALDLKTAVPRTTGLKFAAKKMGKPQGGGDIILWLLEKKPNT